MIGPGEAKCPQEHAPQTQAQEWPMQSGRSSSESGGVATGQTQPNVPLTRSTVERMEPVGLLNPCPATGISHPVTPGLCIPGEQRFSTGVPQECLKHATPAYLVRGTDLFSLRLSSKKNDNSQHNNSHLVNE